MDDTLWPDCSDPDYSKWPNYVNSMLVSLKQFRFRVSDPVGYKKWMNEVTTGANAKKIKGAPKV